MIKGKYYYMSPSRPGAIPIDARTDIFSTGILLYEMLTGQMLYLEEDLHRLLDMVRKADIAPPSQPAPGRPAAARAHRDEGAREAAGAIATRAPATSRPDLERFLHAYAPVFTASKVAELIRQVVGDPAQVPASLDEQGFPSIELRDGLMSTHPLDRADLLRAGEEVRDENSVIFRVAELKPAEEAGPNLPKPMPAANAGAARHAPGRSLPPRAPTPVKPADRPPRLARRRDGQDGPARPSKPAHVRRGDAPAGVCRATEPEYHRRQRPPRSEGRLRAVGFERHAERSRRRPRRTSASARWSPRRPACAAT